MAPHKAAAAFLDAMRGDGIEPSECILNELMSGDLVRFHCVGDTAGRRNGWAKLHLDDRPAGSFGSHKGALRSSWRAERPAAILSREDRAAYRAKREAERAAKAAERAARHEAVASEAQALLDAAAAATAHPYLSRKRISGEGLFQNGRTLLLPMQDAAGKVWNVQRIYADGTKLYLKGGRVDGVFWSAPGRTNCPGNGPLCIGEGVGTMAAVRRATGHAVAASLTAANLEPVARALRELWPDRAIVICADDDAHLIVHPRIRRNLGVDAARAAAAAIGAQIALPPRSHDNG